MGGNDTSGSNVDGENIDGATAAAVSLYNAPPVNKRPMAVTSLLFQGDAYDGWYDANWKANRFYVLNLKKVMADLHVEHTRAAQAFIRAVEIIRDNTEWSTQHNFTYGCSHTSIYPDTADKPKTFAHAVTIIVALEAWAERHRPDYNVYDFLRIIPAQYFIDRFDKDRYTALIQAFTVMNAQDKAAKFGADAERSFDDVCLKAIGQQLSDKLLLQMYSGMCVTRFVAEALMNFVNEHFDEALHIGPVMGAGSENAANQKLGRKNAASALRVPKTRLPSDLFPPYLE